MPRKAHLLLIDDANTLASLARAFRLAGHEATVCDNALRAAELIQNERFDLILSDVVMPGKSGLELLAELKKSGLQTPIVLISGFTNALGLNEATTGADVVLQKSATEVSQLIRAVNRLLRKNAPPKKRATVQKKSVAASKRVG